MKKIRSFFKNTPNTSKGFTIIELIMVISIFGIMTGTLMFNYKDFKSTKEFEIFAQEIALQIKERQFDAMAGRIVHIDPTTKQYPTGEWKPSYGVFLDPRGNGWFSSTNASTLLFYYDLESTYPGKSFEFNDYSPSGACDASTNECLSISDIGGVQHKRRIAAVCDTEINTISDCNPREQLSITFRRPYPDAHMIFDCKPAIDTPYSCVNDPAKNATGPVSVVLEDDNVPKLYQVITINPIGTFSLKTIPKP